MKKWIDLNHWLEWLALSFFTLVGTRLGASSFKVYIVDFELTCVVLFLTGLGFYIVREISLLEYSQVELLLKKNAHRVYFNFSEDELVEPEHLGVIRHPNTAVERKNVKLKPGTASGSMTNKYPVIEAETRSLIGYREAVILEGPELIDFNDYLSGPADRSEKINKQPVPLVGKNKNYSLNYLNF